MLATLGIVHTGLMYTLMYAAVQRLPPDLQGALSFIYPVIAILIDVTVLGTSLQLGPRLAERFNSIAAQFKNLLIKVFSL